ncbi:MAG: phosphoglycolate phosphatase [Allosphingosinicella sp.]|uniref:phosphoglycolate phosphatase n=1 Tax=Allosphingosinicella sp. TaxID=2823234 RepID=UPI0039440AD3
MAPFRLDVVAFDLDGTLADTAPDLAAALNRTLDELGRPGVPAEHVRRLVGHGAKALLRKGLAASGEAPEALVEAGYPIFLRVYGEAICVGSRPYPGVEAALDALREAGAALALCTNKPEGLTHRLLDALGWRGRFASVVGGDTLPVRKPDPAPLVEAIERAGGGTAAFVGDSITDADTARAAGLPFVAVSFGYSDRPADQLGAEALIDHFDSLAGALARLKPVKSFATNRATAPPRARSAAKR